MGRWGYTVFQCDTDRDIVSEFEEAVGMSLYEEDPAKREEARVKLDAGLGANLLAKCKVKEGKVTPFHIIDPRYETLILAAYMMHVGAKIGPEDRQHLKDVFPKIESRNGYAWPLNDEGFRDPGQIQYQAALENYVDGTPRSFFDDSCFNCGKIDDDIAPARLKHCVKCEKDLKRASFCNRECQKENWKKHKIICGRPKTNGGFQWMNA